MPIFIASATFTRPADVTAYAIGDLVANSTTAGSVVPMTFTLAQFLAQGAKIRRARVRKSTNVVLDALFRLHLYRNSPTVTNGDNGAWISNQTANYIGSIDVTVDRAFSDGAAGAGLPPGNNDINTADLQFFGLLEARGALVPASGEVFTVELEIDRENN